MLFATLQFPVRSNNFLLKHCFPMAPSVMWLGSQVGGDFGMFLQPPTDGCVPPRNFCCLLPFIVLSPLFRALPCEVHGGKVRLLMMRKLVNAQIECNFARASSQRQLLPQSISLLSCWPLLKTISIKVKMSKF